MYLIILQLDYTLGIDLLLVNILSLYIQLVMPLITGLPPLSHIQCNNLANHMVNHITKKIN